MSDHSRAQPPVIRRYPLVGQDGEHFIQQAMTHLRPHLPTAISLYRRLQFGRFFPASYLLTNLDLSGRSSSDNAAHTNTFDTQWLMAFVDRSCRPETEAWMFATWEDDSSTSSHDDGSVGDKHIDELVAALAREVATMDLPVSIHQDVLDAAAATDKDAAGLTRADYAGHAAHEHIMLWGAVHARSMAIMRRLGLLSPAFRAGSESNHTFIWDVDALPAIPGVSTGTADNKADASISSEAELPPGLHWGTLQPEHFALVRSRTGIPRQDRTLAVLPNLAIFERSRPVAWVFVGLDASLTTLHVESDFRRRSLAQRLTLTLFRNHMHQFWQDGVPRWAHGYVVGGNEPSAAMCRSIGGSDLARCYWLRMDLQRA